MEKIIKITGADFSDSVIRQEFTKRFGRSIMAEFSDNDLEVECENRNLSFAPDISDYSDAELECEAEARGLIVTGNIRDNAESILLSMNLGKPYVTDVVKLVENITGKLVVLKETK